MHDKCDYTCTYIYTYELDYKSKLYTQFQIFTAIYFCSNFFIQGSPSTISIMKKFCIIVLAFGFILLCAVPAYANAAPRQDSGCTQAIYQQYLAAHEKFRNCSSSLARACYSNRTYCTCCEQSSNSCCSAFYAAARLYTRCKDYSSNNKRFLDTTNNISGNTYSCTVTSGGSATYISAVTIGLILAIAVPLQCIM